MFRTKGRLIRRLYSPLGFLPSGRLIAENDLSNRYLFLVSVVDAGSLFGVLNPEHSDDVEFDSGVTNMKSSSSSSGVDVLSRLSDFSLFCWSNSSFCIVRCLGFCPK